MVTLTINVKGIVHNLTLDEANDLYKELSLVFNRHQLPEQPVYAPWPATPFEVTCGTSVGDPISLKKITSYTGSSGSQTNVNDMSHS